MKGLIIVSVPKSGTNFLSQNLAKITGWRHRWGRPSRDLRQLQQEIPRHPDPFVAQRAVHLVFTEKDLMNLPESRRPAVFGNRRLVAIRHSPEDADALRARSQQLREDVVIAEHPVRSLPFFLRNPSQCPIVGPEEVLQEAQECGYGVIFLHREFKDVVNSLAHFLHAGTRYVQFPSLEVAFEVVVHCYAPVMALAIRTWKTEFAGMQIAYETLISDAQEVLPEICRRFRLKAPDPGSIASAGQFKAFTFRKGGSGDWRNHLSGEHSRLLDELYADLVVRE